MNEIAEALRQRTLRYTVGIIRYCRTLPDGWVEREIGKQLLRAGMGVSGNYWSACRARSHKEFVSKLTVATDEAEENVLWLSAIAQSGVREDAETKELLGEARQLRAILSKSASTARENRRRQVTNSPTR